MNVPAQRVADAYTPVVRGFMIAAAVYYALIVASHPFFETGVALVVLEGLAITAGVAALAVWLRLRRRPIAPVGLEAAAGLVYLLFLLNIVAFHVFHLDQQKLIYFALLALVCGTTAPTSRLAYVSVGVSLACLVVMGERASPDFINDYGYIGLASGFAALGMATLMRGAVIRELEARVASEGLAHAAQEASRAKSAFLATMSHEIRTPLNGVLGMVQAMEAGRLDGEQRERLHVIHDSASSLLGVLNDVLDIAQIESGRLEIRPAPFRLDRLGDDLRRLYQPLAAAKGLAFDLQVDGPGPAGRVGDRARLRQILTNLISNALKFTHAGAISVRMEATAGGVTCRVTDTGEGMSPDAVERVFERFVQADDSATREVGGTGLGLSICRELARLMDGEVTCASEPGAGSVFVVALPLPPAAGDLGTAAAEAPRAPAFEAPASMRILVVDDNPTNQLVLGALLDGLGVAHAGAGDGFEAVEACRDQAWDVVLMDIHMPRMGGVEAVREIRELERRAGRARTPIVAVTASVFAHETRAYLEAGMDDVLAKPIELAALIACLERIGAERAETCAA